MTRLFLLAPFLLLVACEDEVLETPKSATASRDLDDLGDDRVTVELTRYGVIKLGGKAVNLDQLGEELRKAAHEYNEKTKREGRSGWDAIWGGKASKLFLMIRADKQAPWQHVQWLLTEAASERYYKIYFVVTRADGRTGRVKAFLPTDKGINPTAEVPDEIMVSVHVVARKEKLQKWGDSQALIPTVFRYKFGDRESADVKSIAKWVLGAKKVAKDVEIASVRSQIRAGHKVPLARIVEVMSVFRAAGQKKIDFFGTQITHGKLRKKMRLPYPKSNYGRTK